MASVTNTLPNAHQSLFEAKAKSGLTFQQLAEKMNRTEVWVAAVFYGQAKPTPEDLAALSRALGVSSAVLKKDMGDHFFPERGLGSTPPTDALLYRLYEIILVYGYPLKSVIHEKFGDGIMSAIAFEAHVDKVEKEGNDWVKLTFMGKWLPYAKF